jgi:hypothetical protein
MSDLNLITFCYDKYCGYNSGLADGYVLGLLTIIMILVFIEIVNKITEKYTFNEEEEKEETNTKSEDDKKDD